MGISLEYAQEMKNIVNSVFYKYDSKESWHNQPNYGVSDDSTGVHSIGINDFVSINKNIIDFDILSVENIENKIGIKLLKSPNIEYKYFNIFTTSTAGNTVNSFIKEPAIIRIKVSNYENFVCTNFIYSLLEDISKKEIENYKKCIEKMKTNRPEKRMNLQIIFATQYATREQLDNFIFRLAEFPNEKVEIYDSKQLQEKIYISRWNEYIFVYNNIIYIFDNSHNDYSKEDLIHEIELLKY